VHCQRGVCCADSSAEPASADGGELRYSSHGIYFVEAQALWLKRDLLGAGSRSLTEPQYLFIGLIDDKHWSAVVTYRGDTIRIISVRGSRVREVEAYEGASRPTQGSNRATRAPTERTTSSGARAMNDERRTTQSTLFI
jgi:uncharacterized protein